MQSTNSEYGSPYLAVCHFHFFTFIIVFFSLLHLSVLSAYCLNNVFFSFIIIKEHVKLHTRISLNFNLTTL